MFEAIRKLFPISSADSTQLFHQSPFTLLEPMMNVNIKVPKEYIGTIMTDLSKKGNILSMENNEIEAKVPLQTMMGYTNILRSLSKGHGDMNMSVGSFDKMTKEKIIHHLKRIRGI